LRDLGEERKWWIGFSEGDPKKSRKIDIRSCGFRILRISFA